MSWPGGGQGQGQGQGHGPAYGYPPGPPLTGPLPGHPSGTILPAPSGPEWHKLHPLSPVVRGSRALVLFAVYATEGHFDRSGMAEWVAFGVVIFVLVGGTLLGYVKWLVTRWALDGPVLRIETGLLRRDARQLPLARIQAVDIVNPLFARIFGLSEVRVRIAGTSRGNGRLAYLSQPVAADLRARLLAGQHGLDASTPAPDAAPVYSVRTGTLVASVLIGAPTIIALVFLGVLIAVGTPSGDAAAGTGGTFAAYLIGFGTATWRRVVDQYRFTIGVAPDGIRVRRGLFSTVSETIPTARVQAVRLIQPLPWRPFGWCRLEVEVAGSAGQEQGRTGSRSTKALMPVGSRQEADFLFATLLGLSQFPLAKPPGRARWKAPLRYHFLAGATDGQVVGATSGRLRKVTIWLPVEKIQSVRRAEGPVQRRLGLASVLVDAAGRRVCAKLRDRGRDEADALLERLVVESREARRQASARLAAQKAAGGARLGATVVPFPAPGHRAPYQPAPYYPAPSYPGYGPPPAGPPIDAPPPRPQPPLPLPPANPWAWPPAEAAAPGQGDQDAQ